MERTSKYEIDMTKGILFPKILLFSIPLMLSGILQLLFNAADLIVIGQFIEDEAPLAAVGATSSLINFFVNVIIGVSVGSNVIVARYFSSGKNKEVHDAVHTSIALCLLLGIGVGVVAFVLSGPILKLMDTPSNVIELATTYVHIYFAGLPASMLFNFGSAILRGVGDTKRPLYYLTFSGFVNVVLNIIFVTKCNMTVEGVAYATIISQAISAFLVVMCLIKTSSSYKLVIKDIRINKGMALKILHVGLPAGIQGMIFSISNMLIQSSVNFFGSEAMSGNTACQNIEGFVYTSMNAVYQTALSFVSQNYGVGNYKRIRTVILECIGLVTAVGLIMGNTAYLFAHSLISLYKPDEIVIQYGIVRMSVICTTYCLCGIMDVLVGILRGLGYGIMPMIVSLIGACGLRILWIYTVFRQYHTLKVLYYSYPFTWFVTALAHILCLLIVARKKFKAAT